MINAKLKLTLKLWLRKILIHIVIIGSTILLAWLFNKWFEGLLFCISHYIIRSNFDKQYHTVTKYCIPLTITVAFFGIVNTFPIKYSILFSIVVAFFVSWVGYVVKDRIDLKLICNKEVMFRELCKSKGLSKEYEDFAVDWKINQLSEKELLCKYSTQISSIDSVKTRKRRINKALNTR